MKKRFLLMAVLLLVPLLAYSQRTARGVVKDDQGEPLAGASVAVKEVPGKGTMTETDGTFSLVLPEKARTLVFSFVGMETVEYPLKGSLDKISIVLAYEADFLDQVVVTGYAQTTTKRITGSVGILSSDTFKSKPITSVASLMQGEVAGVAVSATSGRPGQQSSIRIRGVNNLSGSSSPLWVVDGVPLQNDTPDLTSEQIKAGGFDDIFVSGVGGINPNDIENVTILKDAAAAAIYGSRAANGVIVVTTKKGQAGRMKLSYSNSFSFSFSPQRSVNLMDSREKLAWEDELWSEFSADKYAAGEAVYPVVGIVGQIRAGLGDFAYMKDDKARQDAYIAALGDHTTDWYRELFRNTFSHNHHVSMSGGADKYTYYLSLGYSDENGMLIGNNYGRYNVTANMTMNPADPVRIEFGADLSRQSSVSPDSYVDAFTYAYFANPYERVYADDGSYAADETYFSLGVMNGSTTEVMPANGFNIIRELSENSTSTVNFANTVRGQLEVKILKPLRFVGLSSYSFSNNRTDKTVGKDTYTAFKDRLGNDKYSQNKLYGSITQNSANRSSYVLRGHFAYNQTFGSHTLSAIAGTEIRGSSSNTIFTKRYNYDPKTATSSLPTISGESDAWVRAVEALSGEYFTENRYASFYASADYYLKKTFVFNFSVRTDGSSNFGMDRQFNPTWSAGGAWHIGEEAFMDRFPAVSHLTFRVATGFTGDVNTSTTPNLVMQYYRQQYRYWNDTAYMLGYIPSAPNPNLRWEKTQDVKASLDLGLWNDALTFSTEGYLRKSTDIVTSSQVLSTTGFTSQYFNSADILNSGVEFTLGGKIVRRKDFSLTASVNFAYNYNKVTRYTPSYANKITVKDRYVEGYPVGAILSGKLTGIDADSGLYAFRLRPDSEISVATDLNKADNYRYYLGTSIAPFTGGFNLSASYKSFRLSVNGYYSLGAKRYDKISSPASYYSPRHEGVSTETVQSQYSDLYSNHLNVTKDRTDRWTSSNTQGVKYPRIYDYFGYKYNFSYYNPMDYNIVDAIYLKDVSYLRIKSIIFTWSLPSALTRKLRTDSVSFNLSLNNFFTITSYDGMDPEVPGATYPTTRSVSFGMNLSL
ncbi:MAG: SusC/RagA family TonB-linked outer membrane protein [Bacteroidia bacterium]|nr:SusC/RagA family TonB-linked outer membrane protein [Bacteroidia bacterium]